MNVIAIQYFDTWLSRMNDAHMLSSHFPHALDTNRIMNQLLSSHVFWSALLSLVNDFFAVEEIYV